MAQGQTLLSGLCFHLPFPYSVSLGLGITHPQMVFVFPRAPSHSMSDICHTKRVMKQKPNDSRDKIFQTCLYLDPSDKEPENFHYLGREITPEEFSKTAEFLCCPTTAQFSIPNPLSPVQCIFGPDPGSYLHSPSYLEQPHSQADEAVF